MMVGQNFVHCITDVGGFLNNVFVELYFSQVPRQFSDTPSFITLVQTCILDKFNLKVNLVKR